MKILMTLFCALVPAIAVAEVAVYGTFDHDGVRRDHYVFVPPDADENTPLIIALHGMGGNAKNLRYGIGMTERAAANGFAVVYPQGVRLPQGSRHWNAGFDMIAVDDTGYLTELARHLIDQHGLSPARVMVFGISMGGYMAYHLSCHSELPIEVIVSVEGTISGADWQDCPNGARVSLLHIHGLNDPLVRYDGSSHWSGAWVGSPPVPNLVHYWARRAQAAPTATLIDHPKVTEIRFANEETGTEVQLLTLPDFAHDWPSQTTAGFPAIDAVLSFLRRHDGRPQRPDGQGS